MPGIRVTTVAIVKTQGLHFIVNVHPIGKVAHAVNLQMFVDQALAEIPEFVSTTEVLHHANVLKVLKEFIAK